MRKLLGLLFLVALICGVFTALSVVTVRTDYGSICSSCGMSKTYTEYVWRSATPVRYDRSPLYDWMKANGVHHDHAWVYLFGTGRSVLGARSRACGRAPPINGVTRYLEPFVQSASNEEIRELVETLARGVDVECKEALRRATDRGFDLLGSPKGR